MSLQEWLASYFKETWEDVKTDVDFTKHTPISTSNSLHIYEERYEVEGRLYRLLYRLGGNETPSVQILKQ